MSGTYCVKAWRWGGSEELYIIPGTQACGASFKNGFENKRLKF